MPSGSIIFAIRGSFHYLGVDAVALRAGLAHDVGDTTVSPRFSLTLCGNAKKAHKSQVPVIYANNNFGHWRSDFRQAVEHCLHGGGRGAKLAETLLPDAEDYFILKPKNSAFYATPLAELLQFLDVKTLVLTGIATDSCVLFTANDAHLRNYSVVVPADCVAAINREDGNTRSATCSGR